MARPEVTLVAAVTANGVIGRDGAMPWRLSSDLKRFKADTIGRPVIMGRRTFDSIGKPLPERRNIVVTRNRQWRHPGVEPAASLAEALALAGGDPSVSEICVIGGGDIFRDAMAVADRLRITHILAEIDGDTYFPEIDPGVWQPESEIRVPKGERDSHDTRHVVYVRRRDST